MPASCGVLFGGVSNLSAACLGLACFSQTVTTKGLSVEQLTCVTTYLPSLDVHIGEGMLPPVLPKWSLLLPLDGLGVIILINPHLKSEMYPPLINHSGHCQEMKQILKPRTGGRQH